MELTREEIKFIPYFIRAIELRTIRNPIKGQEIADKININLNRFGLKKELTDAKIRQFVNYIRANSLSSIIATREGYYTDNTIESLNYQIESLRSRIIKQQKAIQGLEKLKKELILKQQKTLFNANL